MDRSLQYGQYSSNFDSAYNVSSHHIHQPTIYIPMSSSVSFPSHTHRSISPCLRLSNPRFNIDLYKPNRYHSESDDYSEPSSPVIIHHHPVYPDSPPPPSHSHSSSQTVSKLRQLNDELCHTLAQCELTDQLQPSPPPPPSNYHIHHCPIPRNTYHSRSPSESSSSSSSIEPIPAPVRRKRNARITYKAHIPRRQHSLSKLDQVLISTSDAYARDDPMTLDIYPTRDQGFVQQIRNRPDNQSPWLVDNTPIRRNSYSDADTYRSPRAPYYGDKPITPRSRLASGKERPSSSIIRSYPRPNTSPNPLRRSSITFSSTGPVWRPNGSVKRAKFIGSNAPPSKPKPAPHEPAWTPAGAVNKTKSIRAFDPSEIPTRKVQEPAWTPAGAVNKTKSIRAFDPTEIPTRKVQEPAWAPAGTVNKTKPVRAFDPGEIPSKKVQEPIWKPTSKEFSKKAPEYFEPTLKPKLIVPIKQQTAPLFQRKPIPIEKKISSGNPQLKTRIAKAESKVKSAWEPTTTDKEPKPLIPRPVKKTTTVIPPKLKAKSVPSQPTVPVKRIIPAPPTTTDTGRSSLNDVPTKPLFQSTPLNQSVVNEIDADDDADGLFENESQISEPIKKPEIPRPPFRVETAPTELPKIPAFEPDKGTKSTVKDGVFIRGNDGADNRTPSPTSGININNDDDDEPLNEPSLPPSPVPPERKVISPKPDKRDDVSIVDDEDAVLRDDDDERTFQSIGDGAKSNMNASNTDDIIYPAKPTKLDLKTPPRQKDPTPTPPPESPDQAPSNSNKNDQKSPTVPPPTTTTTGATDHFYDFFD